MKTILLVEDEEVIRTPLAELLAGSDSEYRILTADNGREAVNLLVAREVDLVITDLRMPVMDGFALLAYLMRCHPSVPVIVVTAYGTSETRNRLNALGLVDYVEKPTDFRILPGLVRAKLAEGARGRIMGITLAGLLQLLNLERKTCVLSINAAGRRGRLCCWSGELVHAQVGSSIGLEALYEILRWGNPQIEIDAAPSIRERSIDAPLQHVLLEAARILDEAEARRGPPSTLARSR